MNNLVAILTQLSGKLERFRKDGLKETPTRTIFIDPILEALGWDVRDPDEVQLEYPTIDGKSVDYALKINRKPVLLVEAKALSDQDATATEQDEFGQRYVVDFTMQKGSREAAVRSS